MKKNSKKWETLLKTGERFLDIFVIGFFLALAVYSISLKNWNNAMYQAVIGVLFIVLFLQRILLDRFVSFNDELIEYIQDMSEEYLEFVDTLLKITKSVNFKQKGGEN